MLYYTLKKLYSSFYYKVIKTFTDFRQSWVYILVKNFNSYEGGKLIQINKAAVAFVLNLLIYDKILQKYSYAAITHNKKFEILHLNEIITKYSNRSYRTWFKMIENRELL